MRNLVVAVALFIQAFCMAATPSDLDQAVGLWQFPDRGVWVQVDPDGSAFQCRSAPSGRLFSSKGKFVPPHAIEWHDIWGTDQVSFEDGALTLTGKWGVYSYHKAQDPLYERCLASER